MGRDDRRPTDAVRSERGAHAVSEEDLSGQDLSGQDLSGHESRTIPKPPDERLVYRAESDRVVGAARRRFDVLATLGGALAALGTLLLLSSLVGAVVGSIGYLTGVDGQDLSVGGLVAVLLVACLVGGWVAGRMARHREALHGLVAVLWLILLAAVLAALAAVAGDDLDVVDQVGLPNWFSEDALTAAAIGTGLLALALMLLGGWLGGRLAGRHRADSSVELVETRHHVSERAGG